MLETWKPEGDQVWKRIQNKRRQGRQVWPHYDIGVEGKATAKRPGAMMIGRKTLKDTKTGAILNIWPKGREKKKRAITV